MPCRFVRCFLIASAALLGCTGFLGCNKPPGAAPSGPTATLVTAALPLQREVQDYEDYTGRVAAQYSVDLRARVTGYLDKIEFQDGTEVKAGALLFVIDRRPFKAANDSAVALVAVKKAASAFRDAEFKRNQELIKKSAVSQSEFDQSAAAFEEAKAMVSSSEAESEITKLNLNFTEIHAPIAGVVSNRKLDIGNLVVADQTLLTSIVSVDPVYVNFDVDERRLLRIQQEVREGRIKLVDGIHIPIELGLDNEIGFPHPGTIDFADNQIDANTGTIRLRAVVPNPLPSVGKRKLVPGMFARVRVPLGEPRNAVLIAEQAIGSDQGQKFVYVVDAAKKVQYRRVRVGRSERGLVVVEEGLKAGEPIIVAGVQRVRPGSAVDTNMVEMQTFAIDAPTSPSGKSEAAVPTPPAPTPTSTATPAAAPVSTPTATPSAQK
ncbi:MAG: efflux RND transporter periplasmic adaptor subunit [Planctomycetia bacterium]|nr:efflux RND transporter periplasmic adaptor subunit [Planctomycetia bacterium]